MSRLRSLVRAIGLSLSTWYRSPAMRYVEVGLLLAVGWTWMVVRFCGLDVSPPGFFMDEAAPAVHALCLGETGKDMDGRTWPLYSNAAGGGHHPLTLQAFDIFWTSIFGMSRSVFRSVSAFWILVTAFGLFLLARDLAAALPKQPTEEDDSAALRVFPWLVLLAALVSPWSFHFSRIGWESPLAPAFMVLSLVAMTRLYLAKRLSIAWALASGFCAAASMTSYPPLRAVVPFVLPTLAAGLLMLAPDRPARLVFLKGLGVVVGVATVLFSPTLVMLFAGQINGRMNNVAIWRPQWTEHAGPMSQWLYVLKTFLDNVALHLRPSFLFIHGDASLRHSPQISGELSPLDMLALLLAFAFVLAFVVRMVRGRWPLPEVPSGVLSPGARFLMTVALAALLCGFFGVVPAALTFDSLPHAMRAIGTWPCVAMFTGAVLAIAWAHRRFVAPVVVALALAHTLYFLPRYFHAYDKAEGHWFMRELPDTLAIERARGKTVERIIAENLAYSYSYDELPRYYLMSEANMKCEEAQSAVRNFRDQASRK